MDKSAKEMSKMSDEALALAAAGGDSPCAEELISRYKDRVKAAARKYFMPGADQEDIVQEGMIGLFKAVNSFKADGGASFRTYASVCINNQMITAIEAAATKKNAPLNGSLSLDIPIGEPEEGYTVGSSLPAGPDANPAEQAMLREGVDMLLSGEGKFLSPMEKQVARMLLSGLSFKEAAVLLGKDMKSVDNTVQRLRRKLKVFFES